MIQHLQHVVSLAGFKDVATVVAHCFSVQLFVLDKRLQISHRGDFTKSTTIIIKSLTDPSLCRTDKIST